MTIYCTAYSQNQPYLLHGDGTGATEQGRLCKFGLKTGALGRKEGEMDLGSRQQVLDCRGAIDRVGNRQSSVWRQNDTAHTLGSEIDRSCLMKIPDCLGSTLRLSEP